MKLSTTVLAAVFYLFFSISQSFCIDADDPETKRWLNMLGADFSAVTASFGENYIDIDPEVFNSRADRLIWYKPGLTFWLAENMVVQIRVDSDITGQIYGIRAGLPVSSVKRICGSPWIESSDSLYYNLPWHGGPVRLRFVFKPDGLDEIYLYYVR